MTIGGSKGTPWGPREPQIGAEGTPMSFALFTLSRICMDQMDPILGTRSAVWVKRECISDDAREGPALSTPSC